MTETAFALAGLGGFNAHGAGFLAAARDHGVVPRLVTATSGQIVVLAAWLAGTDLETLLVEPGLEHNPLGQLSVALGGESDVFRPAYAEALLRWWTPRPGEPGASALWDRLLPAQLYVPTRSAAQFESMAATLDRGRTPDGHAVGVVFNAYDLATGEAVLFGNDEARRLWPTQSNIPASPAAAAAPGGGADSPSPLRPITAKAVESALWLSLYGFERLPLPGLIDGAYHRACVVSELHGFDRVFVARPLARGWRGRPPANWFEVQDWQTEMWFSAGYKAEVDALQQINRLVEAGRLGDPYRHVALVEVAPTLPAGFANFFIERRTVYARAYGEAVARFAELGLAAVPDPA